MDGVGTEHAGINVHEVDVWDYKTYDIYMYMNTQLYVYGFQV